jgi:single-strand DNA-binding protein
MAGSINKVILVGNVGKDPEIRTLNNGDRVANLSLATSESWRDKASGEKKEKTEWHRVTVFNDHIIKTIESYVKKGTTLYVEGALQTRKYEQNGVEKYATEIHVGKFKGELTLLGGKPATGGGGENQERAQTGTRTAAYDFDDEVPFMRWARAGEA